MSVLCVARRSLVGLIAGGRARNANSFYTKSALTGGWRSVWTNTRRPHVPCVDMRYASGMMMKLRIGLMRFSQDYLARGFLNDLVSGCMIISDKDEVTNK